MTRRIKGGVLEAICKFGEDTEVPAVFMVWAGIATISAVLGRDCFVDQGYFVIYPNLYIVLVAGSARCRKSTAIGIAEDFIKQVNPPINTLSQKMTPEGLIGALSGLIGHVDDSTVVPAAIGIAVVDELSTLIDRNAFKSGMIPLLTDLYDAKDFEYLTRGRGKELIKNPCLTVLGGSTIHWIKESIPLVSIGGGFTSRIVFVYKGSRDKLIPWPVLSAENRKLKGDIIHDLCELAKMRGMFGVDDSALKRYKEEYLQFYGHSKLMDDECLGGYANRRHHILLKVSMIVSASRRGARVITDNDMSAAINILRKAEEKMPLVLQAMTSKEVGDIFEQILKYMMRHKIVSKPELIKRFRHKMTSSELDIFMKSLEEERAIRIDIDGRDIRYTFVGKSK